MAAIAGGIIVDTVLYDVDGGTRAVIFDKLNGIRDDIKGEGTHARIPFLHEPIIMDIRARPRNIHSTTGTKDLQMVNISMRVLSRPEEKFLPKIYSTLGTDFDDRILPSLGNEVLKAVVAQYNAEELLSKREMVSKQIGATLVERAKQFHLILDDVSITHLTFGRDFAAAIESKQVMQQEAERQTYIVAKSDQERKANVIRAEGEAEAAKIINKAITRSGSGLIEVRRIDTAKDVALTLARARNITYLPKQKDSSGGGLLLNVGGDTH
jgi:prohibitin 1